MIIPKDIQLRYAKQLFAIYKPKASWVAHPNYSQLRVQEYYLQAAAVLINRMLADPEICKLFKTNVEL